MNNKFSFICQCAERINKLDWNSLKKIQNVHGVALPMASAWGSEGQGSNLKHLQQPMTLGYHKNYSKAPFKQTPKKPCI